MNRIARRTRVRVHSRECHAPDCTATAIDGGIFCRVCQALLDRVKKELAAGPSGNRRNIASQIPTVQTLDESKAASFDAGLKRRAQNGQPLTESEHLTRAVRIIQLRKAGKSNREIMRKLFMTDEAEIESDLELYRAKVESKAASRSRGLSRDIELDKAIMTRLKTHQGTRMELANELGISYSALLSRITRLRRDGYEIPDGRSTTRPRVAA